MGHFCDGRASAVIGTHSHVPTADYRILARGTAYMTDVGMCGDYDSVIGMRKEGAVARFVHQDAGRPARSGRGRGDLVRRAGRDRRRDRLRARRSRRAARRLARAALAALRPRHGGGEMRRDEGVLLAALTPLVLEGFLFGWSVAWPPGPINAEIVRRGLARGFRPPSRWRSARRRATRCGRSCRRGRGPRPRMPAFARPALGVVSTALLLVLARFVFLRGAWRGFRARRRRAGRPKPLRRRARRLCAGPRHVADQPMEHRLLARRDGPARDWRSAASAARSSLPARWSPAR